MTSAPDKRTRDGPPKWFVPKDIDRETDALRKLRYQTKSQTSAH